MAELLLLSNSRFPGLGFLEHADDALREITRGHRRVLFVPFASRQPDAYTGVMRAALGALGLAVAGLHEETDPVSAIRAAEVIFTGGGNSFRLLATMRGLGLLEPVRRAAAEGVPYLGASAGANLACPTIRTTNDMPIVEPGSLGALGLIPFQLNPHYLDPDPGSTHQGETRQRRIEEFLEDNDVPVLALEEGAWLRVSGASAVVSGRNSGRLFRRADSATEIPAGTDVSFLLATRPRFDVG